MKANSRPILLTLVTLGLLVADGLHAQETNTAIIPVPRDAKWVARHEGFVQEGMTNNPDVICLGDSITDGWRTTGKKVWEEEIAHYNCLNFGIDGDRTQHVLWRIANGEFDHVKPKVIVLMIGTNNSNKERGTTIDRNTTPEVIQGVTIVVQKLREKLPGTKILLLAIFPRAQKGDPLREKLQVVNAALAKLDDGANVRFLDIGQKFLEPDGTLSKEIMPDLLHPNKKGYRIWAAAIEPQLTAMLK
jgi:lysophospholipase L1-like esterase